MKVFNLFDALRLTFCFAGLSFILTACGVRHGDPAQCASAFSAVESKYVTGVTSQSEVLSSLGEGTAHNSLPDGGFTRVYVIYAVPGQGQTYCGSITLTFRNGVVTDAQKFQSYE